MGPVSVRFARIFAVVACFVIVFAHVRAAWADQSAPAAGTGSISGVVADANGSLPVANATLVLQQGTATIATTKTDTAGNFTFSGLAPGTYTILITALGYETTRTDQIAVSNGPSVIGLIVKRAENVKTLGHVNVSSRAAGLQTTTTIQQNAEVQVMAKTNQIRLAEGLGKLPQVNFVDQDSAVGDDIGIDIRGLKPSETQVMLDGHPIGPLGVFPPGLGGGQGGFDFQDGPLFAVSNTLVTYGSGAVGLYGVDAVGGSVDLQTLNPTEVPQSAITYGFGSQGQQRFAVQTSATENKFGYVLLHGVLGTYGDFPSQVIAQTGSRGTDFTSSTLSQSTYPVSADYILRNDLAKFRYVFSPKTSLSFTAYSATSWDDKTGNGDNDFISYPFALLQAQQSTNCTTGSGAAGIDVSTDSGSACITPQQYAQGASGPSGGGPGAFQALRNQDFHLRFLTQLGKHQIAVDGFTDNYGQDRERSASFINGPLSALSLVYRSFGGLISDDIASATNDVGFGFYTQRQYVNGDNISNGTFLPHAALQLKVDSFFLRDAYTPGERLTYFANMWLKHSLVGGNSFDPRLSVVYRPTTSDVFRVTGGASSADPGPIALSLTGPGGINPGNCQLFSVGNAPSQGELPEKASDFEVSLAHKEVADTISQLVLYDTNETNTIFEGAAPASGFSNQIAQYGPNYLPSVYSHIESICPNFAPPNPAPTIANLTITTNLNLAKSRAKGFEFSQRLRANDRLFFDGYYDAQSTVIFDAPVSFLVDNPTYINAAQLPAIPLHKYGLDADFTTSHGGELYLDYTHYDGNNPLARPAYGVTDMSISQALSDHISVNVGVTNLFNSNVDTYGRIGLGVFVPENQFGPDSNGLNQGSERFGLSAAAVGFSVTMRY